VDEASGELNSQAWDESKFQVSEAARKQFPIEMALPFVTFVREYLPDWQLQLIQRLGQINNLLRQRRAIVIIFFMYRDDSSALWPTSSMHEPHSQLPVRNRILI
jgi:hypothetical protein